MRDFLLNYLHFRCLEFKYGLYRLQYENNIFFGVIVTQKTYTGPFNRGDTSCIEGTSASVVNYLIHGGKQVFRCVVIKDPFANFAWINICNLNNNPYKNQTGE